MGCMEPQQDWKSSGVSNPSALNRSLLTIIKDNFSTLVITKLLPKAKNVSPTFPNCFVLDVQVLVSDNMGVLNWFWNGMFTLLILSLPAVFHRP